MKLTELPEWKDLNSHYQGIKDLHLRDLFKDDPRRAEKFTLEAGDIFLDFSKNRITEDTIPLFIKLAEKLELKQKIGDMFSGKKINKSEDRPALHIALRNTAGEPILVDGEDIMPQVNRVLEKMKSFAKKVRSGEWKGFSGKSIKNIVNIGIGGSDLGPVMAYEALKHYSERTLTFRFISNVDGTHFAESTRDLDPDETLFIIASKTFTTLETMINAQTAKDWILEGYRYSRPGSGSGVNSGGNPEKKLIPDRVEDDKIISCHFVALSTNTEAVKEFGIDPDNSFPFWDFVGGRYSLTSAIGLSLMTAIGPENFDELLEGFHKMDQHFLNTPLEKNLPFILGSLEVWYNNLFESETYAILPYDQYLNQFPNYLQQLEMESNGKSVTEEGEGIEYPTGPIIWGKPGTDGQHSFYQLIHQGTKLVPSDFIGFEKSLNPLGDHHKILMANMFAQTQALAFGKNDEQNPHKKMPGNKPTNTILAPKLTPSVLGQLIALYEHKVFVSGAIWGVDSFDQFGVELGKILAKNILGDIDSEGEVFSHDSSTNQLIKKVKQSH